MPEQVTLRRPVLIASAGLVTAAIVYLAFAAYFKNPPESPGLHRSNAVRRSRRRWRRGHAPRDLGYDPVAESIRHLYDRNAARQPYGRYENHLLFEVAQEALDQGRFDLLPCNLGPMIHELSDLRPFTDEDKEALHDHIESVFISNFLTEEFPPGYIIGEDTESLVDALRNYGISEHVLRVMIGRFDAGKPPTVVNWDLHEEIRLPAETTSPVDITEPVTAQDAIEALTGQANDDSDSGWGNEDEESDPGGSQGMLDLLYHIAGEQAKRDGFIHREVRCDSCQTGPIRGIRYHCANCFDFDLCETCEAQQLHHKSHIFYKIRIPVPLRGHVKQIAPVWYPGNPNAFLDSLPQRLYRPLIDANGMEKTEIDSLYEQFKCLAGHHMPRDADPTWLGMAINRKNFDFYFTTTGEDRSPPQNLIYDRIFAFYDTNNDDLITFDEFVAGVSNLQDRTRMARAKRMFVGYDLDSDGYVSRRDFLRMLRAYYAWHKELEKEKVGKQDELDEDIRDAIHGTQPISAAFGWNDYAGHVSRGGRDKMPNANGDLEVVDGPNGVLQNDTDMRGDRARSIGNVAVRGQTRLTAFRSFQQENGEDEPVVYLPFDGLLGTHNYSWPGDAAEEDLMSTDPANHVYGWPPDDMPESIDIINSLGTDLPIDEIMDPTDRARVIYTQSQRLEEENETLLSDARQSALRERWKRRQFYLDEEEGMSKPPGYTEPDSSDDEEVSDNDQDEAEDPTTTNMNSRRQSMRSRSSSKVRFDDSAIDTDHETRSNASSRSIPINERWGGFELGEPERDIGKEILYQTIQQGFNELLDPLFEEKEKEALAAISTKKLRNKWQSAIDEYRARLTQDADKPKQVIDGNSSDASDSSTKPRKLSTIHGLIDHGGDGAPPELESVAASINGHVDGKSTILADPTLPHLRPNDEFTATLLLTTSESDHEVDVDPIDDELTMQPQDTRLATWLKHEIIEQEAIERGGYGKLSFPEFMQTMVKKSISDTNTLPEKGSLEEREIWNSTADLGRLSFLGNWLELARF